MQYRQGPVPPLISPNRFNLPPGLIGPPIQQPPQPDPVGFPPSSISPGTMGPSPGLTGPSPQRLLRMNNTARIGQRMAGQRNPFGMGQGANRFG